MHYRMKGWCGLFVERLKLRLVTCLWFGNKDHYAVSPNQLSSSLPNPKKSKHRKEADEQLLLLEKFVSGGNAMQMETFRQCGYSYCNGYNAIFLLVACSIVTKVIFLRIRRHDFLRQFYSRCFSFRGSLKNSSNDRNGLHRNDFITNSRVRLI